MVLFVCLCMDECCWQVSFVVFACLWVNTSDRFGVLMRDVDGVAVHPSTTLETSSPQILLASGSGVESGLHRGARSNALAL